MINKSQEHAELNRGLKNRHIQMIGLGGAIGTGLFYGSATTINMAGPAISLSYIIGGIIIFFIMRALGEMSVYNPVAGSFSYYAYENLGEFAGFLSGWNYWFNYVIVGMAELSAIGIYINYWLADMPKWISSIICIIVVTIINISYIKVFGEMEFWFSIIKVTAIISLIILGILIILFGIGNNGVATGIHNIWENGGFMPNGIWGLLTSLVVVMFSFGGIELIGITAGEADNPKKTIPKAINQIVYRILIFYIGALFVMMCIFPWNKMSMNGSPFVQILSNLGITSAANILNIVVVTAALSAYNSSLYSNGRMLYSLAIQGNAPNIFCRLSKRGIPCIGVIFSSCITALVVVLNFLVPGKIFIYLMSVATIAGVINWIMIIITQMKFRKKLDTEQIKALTFKLPFYPYSNYISIIFMIMIIILMAFLPDMVYALYICPIWIIIIYTAYKLKKYFEKIG